jgi:hypothetical protein
MCVPERRYFKSLSGVEGKITALKEPHMTDIFSNEMDITHEVIDVDGILRITN